MEVSIDKHIELVFGLTYSADRLYGIGPKHMYGENIPSYCQEFLELFKRYASPELIDYLKSGGFDTYNRTAEIALALDDDYNVIEDDNIKKIKENNPNFNTERLRVLLKDFVLASNYDNFFESHKELYSMLIGKYREVLDRYVEFNEDIMIDFYGYRIGDMKIVLYNFTNGSFGYRNGDTLIDIQSIHNINKDESDFSFSPRVCITCFHEFSHSYINPLGEKYFKDIDLNPLMDYSKSNGLQGSYNDTVTLINEYVIRAAQIYFARRYMEEEYIKRHIEYHKSIGFTNIEEVIDLFDKKESYDSFEEFYSTEIYNYFIELNKSLKQKGLA